MVKPCVITAEGELTGESIRGVLSFKGIPYGEDTGGDNRFEPPIKKRAWQGERTAVAYGPDAPQFRGPKPKAGATTNNFDLPVSEDCLYLNVWTRDSHPRSLRPVMVWLHGGGFTSGSASGSMYDGVNLCNRGDIVLVSVNHRLGALGFLHLAYADESAADTVNLGMLDILLALQWVQRNVQSFGGDPDNVTIFGESGGGRKVTTLLAMPEVKSLFHKAVIQSGSAVLMNTIDGVKRLNETMLGEMDIGDQPLASLKRMSVDEILSGQKAAIKKLGERPEGLAQIFAPVADGSILPGHPFHPKPPQLSKDIPLMVGYNETEWTLFMGRDPDLLELDQAGLARRVSRVVGNKATDIIEAYRKHFADASESDLLAYILTGYSRYPIDSLVLAERKSGQKAASVYLYTMTYRTDAGKGALRTPHALEIPFVFDNVETSRRFVGSGEGPQAMAELMSNSWIAFATHGDPNHEGLPTWHPFEPETRQTMVFNPDCRCEEDYGKLERQVWSDYYFPGGL
ncbi:MAG: carboxylesterase family protein [bacterium]|nr:carboxylesterase/lipase family protein [Gammaproteobacteria bacterium]